ncbi:DUF2332 domain-containing protein [Rhodococcus sp. G-MC3]|uniref:DUF2332 domain-containing protein n=1 Tax=Rhodococcus sp. G-MC3 TaxID=3046209 RepID=UPI0024B9D2B5|nr:DUF2332 domain-containing protein [Rhodococcus sp. G-MC3]MDJ0395869.1 DUF2332 domain-containing protein [Rhodococcus sp. G-MC3]
MLTSSKYKSFGEIEARGNSTTYEKLALGVSTDAELLDLIERLPEPRRQPNLVLGASRHLGAPMGSYAEFRHWFVRNWSQIEHLARTRTTQTNEPGRAALILPLLASIEGPLALVEVGASAGLCLYPDRFSYLYDGEHRIDPENGPSSVLLKCTTTGSPPIPDHLPTVEYRAGIDLNPLDVFDEDHMGWLSSLVWPDQEHRLRRLLAAAEIARSDPPKLVRGDLGTTIAALVEDAPTDVTVVVFHNAVLNYVDPTARATFVDIVSDLHCRWISNEGIGVLPGIDRKLATDPARSRGKFVLSLDGEPCALAGGHGQFLEWFS